MFSKAQCVAAQVAFKKALPAIFQNGLEAAARAGQATFVFNYLPASDAEADAFITANLSSLDWGAAGGGNVAVDHVNKTVTLTWP